MVSRLKTPTEDSLGKKNNNRMLLRWYGFERTFTDWEKLRYTMKIAWFCNLGIAQGWHFLDSFNVISRQNLEFNRILAGTGYSSDSRTGSLFIAGKEYGCLSPHPVERLHLWYMGMYA